MTNIPKILYHGSVQKITDGIIHPKPGHINCMTETVTAVFATTFDKAKIYAARHIINRGICSLRGTTDCLFTTKANPNLSGKFYVYELDGDGFVLDGNQEYYCSTNKPIKNVYELDIASEIQNGNIKIFVPKENIDISKLSPEQHNELFNKLIQRADNFKLYNPIPEKQMSNILNQSLER